MGSFSSVQTPASVASPANSLSTILATHIPSIALQLSKSLRAADQLVGQFLASSPLPKGATELLQKERQHVLFVYRTLLSVIARFLPVDYTVDELMEVLCRCCVNIDEELRLEAWRCVNVLLEDAPQLRVLLTKALTDFATTIVPNFVAAQEFFLYEVFLFLSLFSSSSTDCSSKQLQDLFNHWIQVASTEREQVAQDKSNMSLRVMHMSVSSNNIS